MKTVFSRDEFLAEAKSDQSIWDVVVIGGGATGLGIAVDAATRGYRTILFERDDFAKGTSSRSTKLLHGGVRYLRQRNYALVRDGLRERALLLRNAPHLAYRRSFIIPSFGRFDKLYFGLGLKLYDRLSGKHGIGASRGLSRIAVRRALPTLRADGLRGGVEYFDGEFDDARLAIALARTAADNGALTINHARVIGLRKGGDRVSGVTVEDVENGETFDLNARVVVNAAGAFADAVRLMDEPGAPATLAFSQGTHLVVRRDVLPGESALMLPSTSDGRVLFAIPWNGRVLVGTTDVPVFTASSEPRPLPSEVDFLVTHLNKCLDRDLTVADVKSVFAGIRPLVSASRSAATSQLSRDHAVTVSGSGLVTISGGKWTTYRKMAQDAVDAAAIAGGLPPRRCVTESLQIHGYLDTEASSELVRRYGSDRDAVQNVMAEKDEYLMPMHPDLPYVCAEVVWAVRCEMARTVEDVLARRTRALLLDAAVSIEAAPTVARIMARELGRSADWQAEQVALYTALARGYIADRI